MSVLPRQPRCDVAHEPYERRVIAPCHGAGCGGQPLPLKRLPRAIPIALSVISMTRRSGGSSWAPSVRAICSNRGLTSSKATRAERTSRGKDMTPRQSSTPRQVNTTLSPRVSCKKAPIGPRRPKSFKRINPVATGGSTSGRLTRVSTTDLPGHWRRASVQASGKPNGRMHRVLNAETQAVNQTSCQSWAVMCPGYSTARRGSNQSRTARLACRAAGEKVGKWESERVSR